MSYKFHTADVFTNVAFGGNQLAVIPDARGLTDAQMTSITREFNYSETVFVFPPTDPKHTRKVRIFTPGSELPFAGHPTVGVAFVLAATGEIPLDGDETRIVLEEGVGPVPVLIKSKNGKPYFTQLSAAKMPAKGPMSIDEETIASMLNISRDEIAVDDRYTIDPVSAGIPFLFVPVRDLNALGRIKLNRDLWESKLKDSWAPEIFAFTKKGDAEYQARMFAPAMGVLEDPATGSAAAAFGGYLAWRSGVKDGMLSYTVHQGVEMGRPSLLLVEVDVDGGEVSGVRVGGSTVLVSTGELHAV